MALAQNVVVLGAAGTLYNTYTTAKSILTSPTATASSTAATPLWAGFFQLNQQYTVEIDLAVSNIVTTPGTMVIQFMLGSIVAFSTGNIVLTTTAHTTLPMRVMINMTCKSVGSGTLATLEGQACVIGVMVQNQGTTAAADSVVGSSCMYPNSAPAVGSGFDSTIANTPDIWVGFSTSNAGNGAQMRQARLVSWGATQA